MRRLAVLATALTALLAPAAAVAHPLGNFTVNSYSGIELAGNRVYVHYVLDLAEIPTFQEGDRVRAPGFAARMARGLDLGSTGAEPFSALSSTSSTFARAPAVSRRFGSRPSTSRLAPAAR